MPVDYEGFSRTLNSNEVPNRGFVINKCDISSG